MPVEPFPMPDLIDVVSYEARVVHRCPFAEELDIGTIVIRLESPENIPEVRSLVEWLAGWETVRISHESFVRDIAQGLADVLGSRVDVSGEFETAGVKIRPSCQALPAGHVVPGV